MGFTAPSIVSPIDSSNYQEEIDSNFNASDKAIVSIHNELKRLIGSANIFSRNNKWIPDFISNGNAVIGNDSFIITFGTDDTVTVSHPSTRSACFIDGSIHDTDEVVTARFENLAPSDGTFPIRVLANSVDPPIMSLSIEAENTDDPDLELITFDLSRSGSAYTITNLRSQTSVLPSSGHAEEYLDLDYSFVYRTAKAFDLDGKLPAPFDCEVVGAYARLEDEPSTGGTDSEHQFTFVVTRGTEEIELLDSPFRFFAEDVNTVQFRSGLLTRIQIAEGEIIHPLHIIYDHNEFFNKVQNCSVILRRIFHPVMT